ncbi:MAG TPA: amidohydrolase family protein [Solirubrobacteraceae bacterium]|nr:amidohydrolase family protein [Solirubrobacteraceae bacterium]
MPAPRPSSTIGNLMQQNAGSSRTKAASGNRPATSGPTAADALLEPWLSCLRVPLGKFRIFDCHTHLGCADPDGSCLEVAELHRALEIVDGHAVVFPLAEPDSYRAANDRVLTAAEESGGRLVAFCRVDPHNGAVQELERAVARGAAGVKLHPRAERFGLDDPAVRWIFALANEQRLPIIIHAGRGIPSLGRDALALARAHPRVPVILAHAAIADLAWIWQEAAGLSNLFFDTAWWNIADQLALFALVPPGQILFASDAPYGRPVATAALALRAALAAGLSEEITMIAGGQLERLLAGADPVDLGAAPTTPVPAPGPLLERVHTLLVAAAARLTAGYPAEEYLELARLACELPAGHPDAPVAASVRALLDRHALHLASDPPRRGPRVPGIHLIFVAAAVARTPWLPVPDPASLAAPHRPLASTLHVPGDLAPRIAC